MHLPREPKAQTYLAATATNMTGTAAIGGTALNALGYAAAVFQCNWLSTAVGTFAAAGSNDGTNWYTINVAIPLHPSGAAGNTVIVVPAITKFVKLTYTNISSTGTLGITVDLQASAASVEVSRVIPPSKGVQFANTDIDATAEQLIATATPLMAGGTVRALSGNTDNVYVGFSSAVTASGAAVGHLLDAGESIYIEIDDASKIWAIGGAANQGVTFIGS